MKTAIISLGSNLGDKLYYLSEAQKKLVENGIKIISESKIYKTEPLGYLDQSDFYNLVIKVETSCTPYELLDITQKIELELGRTREFKNAPRTCDIDIISFEKILSSDEKLLLPHPRYRERLFVLKLLKEADPDYKDPETEESISELLEKCPDNSRIEEI